MRHARTAPVERSLAIATLATTAIVSLPLAAGVDAAVATSPSNPGFESGLTGWAALAGTGVSVVQDVVHSGANAAALHRTKAQGPAALTDSPDTFTGLATGTTCTASAWVRGPSGLKAVVKFVAKDGSTTVKSSSRAVTFNGSWQQLPILTFVMPSGASTADLVYSAPAFPLGQTWHLDDTNATCGASSSSSPPTSSAPTSTAPTSTAPTSTAPTSTAPTSTAPTSTAPTSTAPTSTEPTSTAPTSTAPTGPVPTDYRAHWSLDEIDSPTALDSSGNGNDGTNHNVVGDGAGYAFNGVDSHVVVPTSGTLNPGSADFSWGVTVSMTQPPSPLGETYDVLRKGLVSTKGGDYKLEVKNVDGEALARCVAQTLRPDGTKVLAAIRGTTTLADGQPHVVTCTKTSTSITLKVDSLTPRTKTFSGGLGSVSNTSDLALGAKAETTATTGFDWFEGVIFDAWVD
jgi:hypothetical protein